MTAREFHKAWRRSQLLGTASGCIGICLSFVPSVLLAYFDPPAVRERLDDLRRWVGDEGTYGAIGALLMIATWLPFFFIGLAPAYWIDRRFGVRCEHCQRKLTAMWGLHEILRTGRCGKCGGYLFDPDVELAVATTPDPANTVWMYTTISGILILVVLAAHSHFAHDGWIFGTLATSLMASWTGAGVGLCDSIRYKSPRI